MNKKLGLVAFVLALMVLVAGNSNKRTGVPLDAHKLAYIVEHELDHVSAFDLAKSIMLGHSSYRILDLRDSSDFVAYHIPGAENVSLTALIDSDYHKGQQLVLYSEGGVHSAQAMFLLWNQGYSHVYMLKGGISEWNNEVLNPVIPENNAMGVEPDSIAMLRTMSKFFGSLRKKNQEVDIQQPKHTGEREKLRDEC